MFSNLLFRIFDIIAGIIFKVGLNQFIIIQFYILLKPIVSDSPKRDSLNLLMNEIVVIITIRHFLFCLTIHSDLIFKFYQLNIVNMGKNGYVLHNNSPNTDKNIIFYHR